MDRCRRCGYQLSDEDVREREYDELLRAHREPPAQQRVEPDDRERELF